MNRLLARLFLVLIISIGFALMSSHGALANETSTESPAVTTKTATSETLVRELPSEELEIAFDSLAIMQVSPPIPLRDFRLEDISGEIIDTRDFRGQLVWINLWTSKCGPCLTELPDMQALWEKYGDSGLFTILAVNVGDSRSSLVKLAQDEEFSMPFLMDTKGSVWATYGSGYFPTNLFVDPNGVIVGAAIGGRQWDSKEFRALLEEFTATDY